MTLTPITQPSPLSTHTSSLTPPHSPLITTPPQSPLITHLSPFIHPSILTVVLKLTVAEVILLNVQYCTGMVDFLKIHASKKYTICFFFCQLDLYVSTTALYCIRFLASEKFKIILSKFRVSRNLEHAFSQPPYLVSDM